MATLRQLLVATAIFSAISQKTPIYRIAQQQYFTTNTIAILLRFLFRYIQADETRRGI